MARGRSANYDDQRKLILQQAAQLFAQSGYPATSMNQVARACGLSKATLYHYVRDKDSLLLQIAEGHVSRLQVMVDEVCALGLPPEPRLRLLIERTMAEYAGAQQAHRVLTEDVRFLQPNDRQRVLDKQRHVVRAVATAMGELRPDLQAARLHKPLAMLLFGSINWMFTWLRAEGPLRHADMAPLVADLLFGGIAAVRLPASPARRMPSHGLSDNRATPHRAKVGRPVQAQPK